MPKLDVAAVPEVARTGYPEPLKRIVEGRLARRLGDAGGLTQFGVNLVRLKPGAASSQRHWHEKEDEFLYMLEGELVLIENEGETIMRPGDAVAWKAGVPNAHHLINRSNADGVFLVVGTRASNERAHYPDVDLAMVQDASGVRFTRKSGEPY
jgi:uncharacterized cupin superfamily protein